MIVRPFMTVRPGDTTDSPPYGDDEDMLSIRLYHGGKLRWLPRTEYVGGELSVYDFHGISRLSVEEIGDKVQALGYSGFKDLYFRNPSKSLETGLIPLKNAGDFNLMLSYAQENNYRVDIYVKHYNEDEDDDLELQEKDYENLCPDDCERSDSNDLVDLDEEDEEWPGWSDSDYAMSDDDALFDQNVDDGAEWIGKIRHNLGLSDADDSGEEEDEEGVDNGDASDCDSLDSLFEDIYGENVPGMSKIKWPTYREDVPSNLEVGMTFENHLKFRDAITKHSYEEGRMVTFFLSDKTRVKAVCKLPCKWYIYASLNFDKTFQIKQVGPEHSCAREQRGLPLIHSGFLSRKYLNDFRMNPTWPIEAFHKKVMQDLQIDFKAHVLRRAKRKCLAAINGSDAEQYAKLWDYKQELLARNPDSTVELEFEEGKPGVFKRIYICFGGLKHGFKLGCRKVIGLDGTHIKNTYKGQILTAVGVDPNNCMYLVAYAVVETENHSSWLWFLKLLADDLELNSGLGWTLISDRQKGLLNVVASLLPAAEHRFCVRHMHNNFKQKFPGSSLKGKVWAAARSTNVEAFTEWMAAIKNESAGAHDWLASIPSHHWSRSHFTTDNKCDILLNNMCESFNRCIIFARQQGILVMLEMIREYLMKRLQNKREICKDWDLNLNGVTPKARGLVEKYKKWSGGCYSSYAGYNQFEVNTVSGHKFAVDLNKMTCGCRRWDLTGIPCHHAIAGMNRLQHDPYDFIDVAYSVKTFKQAYSGIIYPMNGERHWVKSGHIAA